MLQSAAALRVPFLLASYAVSGDNLQICSRWHREVTLAAHSMEPQNWDLSSSSTRGVPNSDSFSKRLRRNGLRLESDLRPKLEQTEASPESGSRHEPAGVFACVLNALRGIPHSGLPRTAIPILKPLPFEAFRLAGPVQSELCASQDHPLFSGPAAAPSTKCGR